MNFLELRHFLILANLLHFGKASQACHLSPSALTRSIQRLEETLGQALFLRDNRSVTLTTFGEKFRSYASQTLRNWDHFYEENKGPQTVEGHLSIYASVTAVYGLLPNILEQYRSAYPEVQLELRTGSAEASINQVIDADIDLSVAAIPDQAYPQLAFMPLAETKLVFVGLSNEGSTSLDIHQAPLVLPRNGLARRRLDQWLKKKRITPNIAAEVSGNEGILAMVRLGCGVGIVPELVLERSPFREDLKKLDTEVNLKPYTVGLCTTNKNLQRPSIAALWQMAKS